MKPLILVVDSDADARHALGQFLEESGYEAAMAEGGKRAVHLLSRIRPAIILMDADMPVMNGFEACAEIQSRFTERKLPIIMMTALGNAESVNQAFAAGAEEYVTKPIHRVALRQRIMKTLERQAIEKALRDSNDEMEVRAKKRALELVQVNEALHVSEEKLRGLVEAAPDAILILDETGEVSFINHAPPGHHDNDLKGNRLLDVLPKPSKPRFKRAMNRVFTQERGESFQIEGPSATWWQIRTVPLVKRKGDSHRSAMVIVTDQTKQYNTQTQAMQNARLATVGALAASVAHEVNNPNNAILLQASWLAKAWRGLQIYMQENEAQSINVTIEGKPLPEAMESGSAFLADITNNSRRIGTIVGNLKRMSRPDDGAFQDHVRIEKILDSALSILANQILKYCESCTVDIEPDLPHIRGNLQQLEQVFINLILNALQALPDRKRKVGVRARHDVERRKIAVIVEDEGVGIPEENIEKILLPFFTTKLAQGGTGLGLAICQSILSKHHSGLEFDSAPGRGTTVRLNFPISRRPSGEAP